MIDLTFSNKLIKDYFEGTGKYEPVNELMYLHDHPLIKQSFLVELEKMIHATNEVVIKKNIKGAIIEKLANSTIIIGAELSKLTEMNAPVVLKELRNVYKICKQLLK